MVAKRVVFIRRAKKGNESVIRAKKLIKVEYFFWLAVLKN
jgi:hypothetical protein